MGRITSRILHHLVEKFSSSKSRYYILRWVGHAAALAAIVTFLVAYFCGVKPISPLKTELLTGLLLGWFVLMPVFLSIDFGDVQDEFTKFLVRGQRVLVREFCPYVFIVAFVAMAASPWR